MGEQYEDQVPRLERFAHDHPEVEILSPLQTRTGFWKARRDGELLASGIDLRRLLDSLCGKLGDQA